MKKPFIRLKQALKILSEKQPVSKLTFVKWCNEGKVAFETEKHGMFKYRVFKRAEIERIKALLPKERINGFSLLPPVKK